jgi:ribonucleoside-diphosphate reductase alpha chain
MRQKLLKDRYLQPNETIEEEMYERVANFIARSDSGYRDQLYQAMCDGIWLPNTPTLVNAGVPGAGGLSACYVLPIEDSLDGIYRTVWHAARVHKYFGGTGFNFSRLRERGAPIRSTGGKACGPLKVMELLNESAGVVSQGGKREGANMGILNADHPDIHEFIHCKDSGSRLSHFNISVGLRDSDMQSGDGLVHEIAEQAWRTGDPGVIFLDRLNEGNSYPEYGEIDCTNPCGEQPLRPYESCNLGSINLSALVEDGEIPTYRLGEYVRLSVRALNDIIDLNTFPIPEIETATKLTRKIGSGVMGWADALLKMGISYQSKEAIDMIKDIGDRYRAIALDESRGRNETLITIAPTGTLSYLAGCSWGIEPIFDWTYTRESESGIETLQHPLMPYATKHGLLKDTAKNISVDWQLQHMSTWQRYVDNAVSKTINLPSTATVEQVEEAIYMAWELRCKGITVYRDGSKDKQVVRSTEPVVGRKPSEDPRVTDGHNVERFGTTIDFYSGCGRIHVTCNERDKDSGRPFEVYNLSDGGCVAYGEALGKVISKYIHDPRLVNGERETVQRIVKTLHKVSCPTALRNAKSQGKSCPDIIAKRMEKVWLLNTEIRPQTGGTVVKRISQVEVVEEDNICPQCGAVLSFGKGCRNGSCVTCGWSGCS